MIVPISILLFVAALNVSLGLLAFYRQPYRPESQLFALYCGAIALWPFSVAMFMIDDQYASAYFWVQLGAISIIATLMIFVLFLQAFSTKREDRSLGLYMILTLPLSLLIAALITQPEMLISGLRMVGESKQVKLNPAGYIIYSSIFFIYAFGALAKLYGHTRLSSGSLRIHLRYLLIGSISSIILGFTLTLIALGLGEYSLVWLGPILTLPYVVLMIIAMLRHQMFDMRLLIARSLTYLFSVGLLLIVYTSLGVMLAKWLLGSELSGTEQLFYAALAVVLAMLFPLAKRFFDHYTSHLFYRRSYNFQVSLDAISKVIVNEVDLDRIADHVRHILSDTLKPKFSQFLILENEVRQIGTGRHKIDLTPELKKALKNFTDPLAVTNQIERDNELHDMLAKQHISVVVRLLAHDKPLGYLFVGEPRSGSLYATQDYRFLKILSHELVLSIQNAKRFQEIHELNANLQKKIDEATHELRSSNQKLRELDEAKDEFVSMASHQLRTPLTSVKGYISMVMEGDAGKISNKQHELLESAFASSQRMVYLIADLLNASRLKTGKFVIEPGMVDLRDVLATEIKQLQETAATRGLELTYTKPEEFPTVMLDENKIHQVIMNFIDNAIYYTPTGGKINVSLSANDKSVEFKVVDSGIGVPKAEQHKLFAKFFRAGNARKARPDGTGLGLFMAQKIVVAQYGAIIFHSEEGKGSTFGFSFPLSRVGVRTELKDPADKPK